MYSRSLATVTTVALAGMGAIGELAPAAVPAVLAQDFRNHGRADESYSVSRLYDRVTDSTRISATLSPASRPFGLGSMVWLSASFTFSGRQLPAHPEFVMLSLESWTPNRGGWAFAHPRVLRVETGKARLATIPAAEYVKRRVYLFDAGRREELSFRVTPGELAAIARESELVLRAGSATVRLDERHTARLRALVRAIRGRDRGTP